MIKIYKVLREIFFNKKDEWNETFAEGYKYALMLLQTGIENHVTYNSIILLEQQKESIKDLNKVISTLKNQIRSAEQALTNEKFKTDRLQKQIDTLKDSELFKMKITNVERDLRRQLEHRNLEVITLKNELTKTQEALARKNGKR